jgi:cytochrome b561
MEKPSAQKSGQFSTAAKWCHWLVAWLMLSLMWEALRFRWQEPAYVGSAIPFHVALGLIILAITIVRLSIRSANPPPELPATTPKWMITPAKLGHFLLYAIFLYMAVLGIWMAAISPADIRVMSQINLSALAPANPELYAVLKDWHYAGAISMTLVLIGHICAALWHHVILKDNVLSRILPFTGFAGKVLDQGRVAPWRFPSTNRVDWHRKSTWFQDNT